MWLVSLLGLFEPDVGKTWLYKYSRRTAGDFTVMRITPVCAPEKAGKPEVIEHAW
jgi:hypothetical protein